MTDACASMHAYICEVERIDLGDVIHHASFSDMPAYHCHEIPAKDVMRLHFLILALCMLISSS